jgi:RNA polymerase sigma-70 factor (ECF subfamily)
MPSSVADLAALGKMLEEHRPRLLAMLRRRINSAPIDPEDILQETLLLARRRWQQFKEQARMTPYAWLFRLALDCLIEEWRRRNRAGRDREMPLPEHSSILMVGAILGSTTSPSQAVAREEFQQQMRQILSMLKPGDREILWLRHYDELSFKEAAAVLGVPQYTAAKRYVRALQRLKELWQQCHPNSEVSG